MFIVSITLKHVFRLAAIAGTALILSGCLGGPSIPDYPGSGAAEPAKLTEVVFEKATISLAPGWDKDTSMVNNDTIVAGFKKGPSIGYVQCMSSLLKADVVGDVMREGVAGASGNAQLVRGPFAVAGGLNKPYIEVHQGTVTSEGQEIDAAFYIGYNSFRYLGCNYGVMLIHTGTPNPETEAEFVAMFRTLK